MVALVADMSMGAPGAFGDAPLMMGRERARSSHKAKRGLLCQPGKPLGSLWLKGEQAPLGTDHHIVPLRAILHARDDMHRLARALGRRTSARSSRRWLRAAFAPAAQQGRSREDWLGPTLQEYGMGRHPRL